ncbi:MAG TPA: ATP-binding protein [Vicinamibacterales bacterium]|jgi:signal transduction histidine kinase
MTLAVRLSLFGAAIVLLVVASVTWLEMRSYEQHLTSDLADAGRLAAQSAASAFAQSAERSDASDVRDALHDLLDSDPVLDAISVIDLDAAGRAAVFASTSTEERAEVLDLASRAIAARAPLTDRRRTVLLDALPVPRRPASAVVVTVGLESVIQMRTHALRVAMGFAVPTVVLVTLLVYVANRQLVGRPLRVILQTMEEAAAGGRRARAGITRPDELGMIAARLNAMLDELERFNLSLEQRIADATRDLSLRNAQLAASQNQLLAARESLAQAERVAALGQAAANVAHQVGTPLNLISGYVQMILEDSRTDERTRTRLQTVDAQIREVTRVLRTMLDRARRPSGLELVALAEIVERVREVAEPRLNRAGIRLATAVPPSLPAIRADATQLEMALLNLVTNALDVMPSGGTLTITASNQPSHVRIEVADSGPGLPAAILERLFDPWVTTKPAGQGSGLGLAIVRDVVRTHGGTVRAYNGAAGAVFVIDLPAAASLATPA